ncbi:hypothetical protein VSDG_04160 [Cytospora chrysosperma]|uniref:Major facilitator superfamily (MFS) profile domain-containing protein n=1 Tax=Cytospora chrysosperma TaxID=252740 RepID=A0A423W0U2_CYTCH|nr:hypothetical protein VSDG_04160 [Valsa sordida]
MNVSVQDINLTVTSYLIASGIFPTVTGSVADIYGRRVTLMVSLTAYAAINVGLATQRSFAALFILRMLQSVAISGRVVNRDYRITAKANGMVIDRLGGDDLSAFPIEHARLRTHKYAIAICAPLIAVYGWVLQLKTNMAVPLVLQFLIGYTNQVLYTSLNTLMVDYHPDRSASVQAANNLVRCELAAVGLAVLDIMIRKMGPGWCFVVFAILHGVTLPVLFLLERRGIAWRKRV